MIQDRPIQRWACVLLCLVIWATCAFQIPAIADTQNPQLLALHSYGKTLYQAMRKQKNSTVNIQFSSDFTAQEARNWVKYLPSYASLYGTGIKNGEFYLNEYAFSYKYYGNTKQVIYNLIYLSTPNREQQEQQLADQLIASQHFNSYSSDYAKIKAIYDYLCKNVSYIENLPNVMQTSYNWYRTAYSAMKYHKTVCTGYAGAFYWLTRRCGIDSHIIVGTFQNNGATENHAYNTVKLNGKYYNLDPTNDAICWEYANGQKSSRQLHDYRFFLTADNSTYRNQYGYTKHPVFSDASYTSRYPMATQDYKIPVTKQSANHGSYTIYAYKGYQIKLAYKANDGTWLTIKNHRIRKNSWNYNGQATEYCLIRDPNGKKIRNTYRKNRVIQNGCVKENNKTYNMNDRALYYYNNTKK